MEESLSIIKPYIDAGDWLSIALTFILFAIGYFLKNIFDYFFNRLNNSYDVFVKSLDVQFNDIERSEKIINLLANGNINTILRKKILFFFV